MRRRTDNITWASTGTCKSYANAKLRCQDLGEPHVHDPDNYSTVAHDACSKPVDLVWSTLGEVSFTSPHKTQVQVWHPDKMQVDINLVIAHFKSWNTKTNDGSSASGRRPLNLLERVRFGDTTRLGETE